MGDNDEYRGQAGADAAWYALQRKNKAHGEAIKEDRRRSAQKRTLASVANGDEISPEMAKFKLDPSKVESIIEFAEKNPSVLSKILGEADLKREYFESIGFSSLNYCGRDIPLDECDGTVLGRAFYLYHHNALMQWAEKNSR